MRFAPILAAALAVGALAAPAQWKPDQAREVRAALDRISPNSLRGHVAFLASDLLEGRGTPSRGLDIAAEYIASQFHRAGLEPAVEGGYFQTTKWRDTDQKVRNVLGVLRGSDPKLKDTYVIVSAHYDHMGINPKLEGDQIFNGANDDGSGTASVIEVASALASMKQRPKRTIVFAAWYGEERGLVGSRFYGRNPVFPVAKTVAMLNLEHMGRTDDLEGPRLKSANLTGFDYSDVAKAFLEAGRALGVRVWKHESASDAFFGRSDNQALADLGVPAHAMSVAYIFPDYHKVGDHWDKIDYDNLALINRMVALGVWTLANSEREPQWNAANPRAQRYLQAWRELRAAAK